MWHVKSLSLFLNTCDWESDKSTHSCTQMIRNLNITRILIWGGTGWNDCTTYIFNYFKTRIGCTSLKLFWIFSNPHRVKSIHTGSNIYIHSNFSISGAECSARPRPIRFSLMIMIGRETTSFSLPTYKGFIWKQSLDWPILRTTEKSQKLSEEKQEKCRFTQVGKV